MGKKNVSAKNKKGVSSSEKKHRSLFFVLSFVFIVVLSAVIFINLIFNFNEDLIRNANESFEDVLDNDAEAPADEIQIDMLTELRESGDLFTVLKTWATTNTENSFMRSRDVMNILLVGLDSAAENSDVMLIVSVDQKNGRIVLTSVMRDSYTYMSTPVGEMTAKMNAAYANGGIKCLVETLENSYKIKLDHYVSVNFESFIEVVDALGGIKVPVKQYEMREMNRVARNEGYQILNEYGDEVLLNGQQALMYCRIRKCDTDGDVSRTRRQRQFVSSLIAETKELSVSQATSIINTLRKYVKTDCSTTDIISLATKAIKNKWYDYEISTHTFPKEENRMD